MRIRPTDLTHEWLVRLVQFRDGRGDAAPEGSGRLGFWGELWMRGSGLDRATAAAVVQAASVTVTGSVNGICAGGFLLAWLAGVLIHVESVPLDVGIPIAAIVSTVPTGIALVQFIRMVLRSLLRRPVG